jgi:hypothetical protein
MLPKNKHPMELNNKKNLAMQCTWIYAFILDDKGLLHDHQRYVLALILQPVGKFDSKMNQYC